MNKGLAIIIALLISALVGMGALYQFYVKAIIEDLQQKQTERGEIEGKLKKMEDTFFRTKPEVIIKAWRQDTQPWADAVIQRSRFFQFDDRTEPAKVPEGKIPKFYYGDEFPKLQERLEDYIDEKRCTIPGNLTFGAPDPSSLTGKNPKAEEVEKWLDDYQYGANLVRFIADSGASNIQQLEIWPEKKAASGSIGTVNIARIGFLVSLTYDELVAFLETMRTSERYFSVDSIMITNKTLRNPDAELSVKMLLTQAQFVESEIASGSSGSRANREEADVDTPEMQDLFKSMFGTLPTQEVEESWWQKLRKKLPF